MGREFELKYRLKPEALALIREEFGAFTAIAMETVYFDTPTGELGRRRWTLRRRMENGVPVCTLKIPLADGSRGEWETECESLPDAAEPLIALGAPAELRSLMAGGLVPTCGARFTRLAKTIPAGDSLVELALDQGELLGGSKTMPLCELEVELKQGSDAEACAFAAVLARRFSLEPEPISKFRRALNLAAR